LKFFAWNQSGERLLDNTPAPACVGTTVSTPTGTTVLPCSAAQDAANLAANANPQFHKRDRSGLGMKYMGKSFRVSAEYIIAKGMIFEGPDKPSFTFASTNGADAKANGWYLDGGWYIPNTRWELDARYDTLDANTGATDEHTFSKWTLGTQYHFNPRTRVTLNYEIRDFKCTASTAPCANVNKNLSGVGNKLGVQLTAGF
jgi:predicted porin